MTDTFEKVSIEILGQHFDVKCLAGDAVKVQAAAEFLTQYLEETKKDSSKHEKLLINAALNLSNDILQIKSSLDQLEEKIDAALATN